MEYQVIIPKKVLKELEKIDKRYKLRIEASLVSLAGDPYLGKKLSGKYKGNRSYEVWPYRIIYRIRRRELIILIIQIGHRQGIYK